MNKKDTRALPLGQTCELLIRADGEIYVHNLTTVMAKILLGLNPDDEAMRLRTRPHAGADVAETSSNQHTP